MKKIILFLIISIAISSCNLFGPGPNPPFCCKINGKTFTPESSSSSATVGSNSLQMTWDEKSGIIFLRARNSPISIIIYVVFEDKKISEGKFTLSNNLTKSRIYFAPNNDAPVKDYLLSKEGFVEITKKDGYLLSGKFEFKTTNVSETKKYDITKGEFNNLSYY